MIKKDIDVKVEKWWKKKHNDIETSVWISDEMKCAYRNMLKQAYKDGLQEKIKDQISSVMKG